MKFLLKGIIIIPMLYCNLAFAEIYKWVDEDGNTHYSQSPPVSDVEVKTLDVGKQPDSSSAQENIAKQTEKADTLREERLKKAEEKSKLAAEKKAKEENCMQAKNALQSYTQNPRLLTEAEDGGQRKLTEEERQEKIAQSRQAVEDFCN